MIKYLCKSIFIFSLIINVCSCQCNTGFTGIHCTQRTVDCLKSPPGELCGHGICVPAKTDFGYQCICEQGWTTNGVTPACTTDVDECELNKNRCHSTCINLPGSFHCGPCHQGYTGNGLVCRDINECENNNGGCSTSPQVNCINTEGSYHCGQCPPGWSGDGRYCSRSDSISCPISNPCFDRTRCQYISGEMVCTCPPGMQGNGYGSNGCRYSVDNPCGSQNPCAVSMRNSFYDLFLMNILLPDDLEWRNMYSKWKLISMFVFGWF